MASTLEEQINQLKQTIAELESQRASLGEEVVETALTPLLSKLDDLLGLQQASIMVSPQEPEEQRKLVSVLCADLVGFTNLSSQLDPEELREIQQSYFSTVTPPIKERGGLVEKYIGDAVLAVFGLPQAHEDDPELAVRAALEMQSALTKLNLQKQGETGFPLLMRVGVSTGMVLATLKPGGGDFVITGEMVNLASRLQGLAPPGGVLIPHNTYRHLRGAFDVQVMQPLEVKGLDKLETVYQVLRFKPRAFRQVVRGVEGIETSLVGRHDELKFLQDAMLGVIEEHEGQVVTISGEAGVGKSRLLYEFQNWIELLPQRVRFFQGKARQEAQGLPYGLLRDLVAFRFQILEDDRVEEVWLKLEAGFGEVFGTQEEGQIRAHFLGQLLGYDFSLSPHLKTTLNDAEQLRNRGLMYLIEYFKALCEQNPVVVILEDLHWADDSSLDMVNRLGELTPHLSLLIVGAARHTLLERRPFWGEGLPYHHFIELGPLSRRESRQLVGEILKLVDQIPLELRDLVVEGGEGNPFYIEELIKMLVEGRVITKGEDRWYVETQRLEQLTVPPTLAGVLQARLDSLPKQERIVLQEASVVGRLFWDRVVAHIHTSGTADNGSEVIPPALAALRSRELVYRREESAFLDAREYLFKHDLLREVTYESVLKRLRKTYHAMTADWLIAHSGERVGEYRGLIAEHLLLGGRKEQALEYLLAAGKAALASFANPEAEVYFRQALDLNPIEAQRADLLAGLGEALKRQARHEEGAQVFRQGIELYRQLGDQDREADLYAGLSVLLWMVDYLDAWRACQEGLELLKNAPDSSGLARLLAEAGRTAHFRAESHELVEALCQRAITMAENFGDLSVQSDALITLAIQFRDIQKSIRMLKQAVALSETMGPCYTTERAHTDLGFVYDEFLIDLNTALKESLRAAEIARQIGDIDYMFFALFNVGSSQVQLGNLNSVLEYLADFLRHSTAPPERVKEFLRICSSFLRFPQGEWLPALEFFRAWVSDMRKVGKFQEITDANLSLVNVILDLNSFAGQADLSEAETALLENIKIGWHVPESRFLLVIVSARQGRLAEAKSRLAEALEAISQPENNKEKVDRLEAEAEVALAEKQWGIAVSGFQSRIEIWQASGFRWLWAHDLIRLGDAFRQRGEPGDPERAREAYQQSLVMFTGMGAPGYIAVLESRLQDLQA